jgi:hypothetical protein
VWTENRVDKKGDHNIQPVVADDEIAAMRERLSVLESRGDAASRDEAATLRTRLTKAAERRERILGKVPADLYELLTGVPALAAGPR